MAYPNCQHQYSCTLGPSVSKIRWPEHEHCNATTADLIIQMATEGLIGGKCLQCGDTGQRMIHVWVEYSGKAWDNITLLRSAYNLKFMNCLLNSLQNFPCSTFGLSMKFSAIQWASTMPLQGGMDAGFVPSMFCLSLMGSSYALYLLTVFCRVLFTS